MSTLTQVNPAAQSRSRISLLKLSAITIALLLAVPVLIILVNIFLGGSGVWQHLLDTLLFDYISNSLLLMLGVTLGTLAMGVPAAWLTSVCNFPGRSMFAWALLLPLAMPAYIIAYTYTGLFDFAGPVQTFIRDVTGLGYGEYWFFEMRSLGGAFVMLSLVLYPYVYLMSRAAFLEQSANTLEVCRTLGYSAPQAFFRLALPMARPAIVAGVTLAMMETLADYGTVQYFGVTTFTTGIMRTFYGFGDLAAASQLAGILLLFVAVLIFSERYSRRKISYHTSGLRKASQRKIELRGVYGVAAFTACAIPVLAGFVIPALVLFYWAMFEAEAVGWGFIQLAWNSFYLAALAAMIAVSLAMVLAYAGRLNKEKSVQTAIVTSGMGYALPGTIIAIGVIVPLAWLDHRIIEFVQHVFEIKIGLFFSGTIAALLFAYTVRFMAVSLGSVQSGLGKVKPSMDMAGRSLGCTPAQVLRRIHVPLLKSSVLTALLIVFVDVLKELPATLILRPFNFNTLAVRAFELASDERLVDAAPASLMIVAVGLIPVILLSRSISSSAQHEA
ncbi:Sulfate transport system permease protein CysW [Marinomonas gallaica]|uniref:Sulfate transport system permease protein CysW n=1 Tax=Marinomonas gallaica TaxID=1806667 RepID=A0A1C3JPQ2_9GAMM|nr:iron ABC transporter permease [Marinomonas gallaica]SBT17193.1 Sulfate transport system permease protein CysW [Marinomonas gallaica]SBT19528.1 Sulfate transport system permease protein CysW [Marinomonas gallaica]